MANPILQTKGLERTFKNGEIVTRVLKGIDFSAERGEWVAIMGRSGAGKSTFMYLMSLLDEPTGGSILIDGREAGNMNEREKVQCRLTKFGYVFQDYALLPELTAAENVGLPLMMERYPKERAEELAHKALTEVNLGHRPDNLPSQLSGGEQQRVSIARAIAERPEILFADEPTANLDRESSAVVMEIFKKLHAAGQTIIMVTHEEEYAKLAQRIVRLDDGKVVSTEKGGS